MLRQRCDRSWLRLPGMVLSRLLVRTVMVIEPKRKWKRLRMAPSAFITPAATASPSSIPGATGTPSPRIEPCTFQETGARVLEAESLHGCAAGSGSPAGSRSPEGGGPPAPGSGGRWEDPFARPDADRRRPPVGGVVPGRVPRDLAVDRAVPLPDAPAPVLPVEDTATDPPSPLDVADDDATCAPLGWAPVGNASALDPAWADAKGPASPPGITPLIMASACSR